MEVWGTLRQLRGEDATLNKTHDLKDESVTFGRVPGTGNRVILPFPYVSGTHFTITKRDGSTLITSFGSNGTYLNDEALPKGEEAVLSHGDMVSIKYQQKEKLVMEFRLASHTESIPHNSSENKAQEKRIQSYIAKMESMSAELSAAKLEVTTLKEAQEVNQALIEEQRQVILEHESKISAYEAKHMHMTTSHAELKAQYQQLQASAMRVSDLELKCTTLKDELEYKTSQYDSQSKVIESCHSTIASLKQQVQELQQQNAEYSGVVSELQSNAASDHQRLQQANYELSALQTENSNTKVLLEHAQMTIDRYNATQQQHLTASAASASTIINSLSEIQQMFRDYSTSVGMNTLNEFVSSCPPPSLKSSVLPKPELPATSSPIECTQVHTSPVRSQQSHVSPVRTQQLPVQSFAAGTPQSVNHDAVSTPPEADLYMATQCDVPSAVKRKFVEELSDESSSNKSEEVQNHETPPESQSKRARNHDQEAVTQQQALLSLGIDNTDPGDDAMEATNAQNVDYSYNVSSTTQQQTQYVPGSESDEDSSSSDIEEDIVTFLD